MGMPHPSKYQMSHQPCRAHCNQTSHEQLQSLDFPPSLRLTVTPRDYVRELVLHPAKALLVTSAPCALVDELGLCTNKCLYRFHRFKLYRGTKGISKELLLTSISTCT